MNMQLGLNCDCLSGGLRVSEQESNKLHVNLNPIAMEADLAYFIARMELVGTPETSYQVAQLKVYRTLAKALEDNLQRLRRA
jgi:hypothetical protein